MPICWRSRWVFQHLLLGVFRTAPVQVEVQQRFHRPKAKNNNHLGVKFLSFPPPPPRPPQPLMLLTLPRERDAPAPQPASTAPITKDGERRRLAKNTALCCGSVRDPAGRAARVRGERARVRRERAGSAPGCAVNAPQCAAAPGGPRRRDARPAPGLRGLRLAAAGWVLPPKKIPQPLSFPPPGLLSLIPSSLPRSVRGNTGPELSDTSSAFQAFSPHTPPSSSTLSPVPESRVFSKVWKGEGRRERALGSKDGKGIRCCMRASRPPAQWDGIARRYGQLSWKCIT